MLGGSELFEGRKWRLVQVPPLPTPSPLHFAASYAPSDQPVSHRPSHRQSRGSGGLLASRDPLPPFGCLPPSCCTEFSCLLVLVYLHVLFSNPLSPMPLSKIEDFLFFFLSFFGGLFRTSTFSITLPELQATPSPLPAPEL